ncbi:MAG: hypothetical protein ABIG63_19600 [Chloroflexota bacterium]
MKIHRQLFCLITLTLVTAGLCISYVDPWTPALAANHQSLEARFFNNYSMAVASDCPDNYCIYLPIVLNSVPEIDVPPCRWPHNSGQNVYISYKWGNRLQISGSLWRNAFEDGIPEWNNAQTLTHFYYSISSDNVINTYNLAGDGRRGKTIISCLGSETVKVDVLGNIYYDIQDGYTVNQRRGIATHEVGHGQSIGHIPNDYPLTALMYKSTPLSFFSTIYTPQSPDIALVNQIYR